MTPLVGTRVRLEPLDQSHAEALWKYADPQMLSANNMWAPFATYEEFKALVRQNAAHPDRDSYATVLNETGEPVGSTSYLDKRPEHKGIEVGGTWIGAPHQRTFVNPEAKFLMLRHAFEVLGCIRVQLKTDANNIQSQKAMEKLGCVREGVLRNHMICYDGRLRSSVFYSVTNNEWPSLRRALIERLGYEPAQQI